LQKFKFDARMGPTSSYQDLYTNPWKYSFVHNFKVHYKQSIVQALAHKADVSISSANPQIPSLQDVTEQFNQRMQLGNVHQNIRGRFAQVSYHITNIEYKESFAFYDPQMSARAPPTTPPAPTPSPFQSAPAQGSQFCTNCGNPLPPNSKFCNKCGTIVPQ
jgi:hypothetical protein